MLTPEQRKQIQASIAAKFGDVGSEPVDPRDAAPVDDGFSIRTRTRAPDGVLPPLPGEDDTTEVDGPFTVRTRTLPPSPDAGMNPDDLSQWAAPSARRPVQGVAAAPVAPDEAAGLRDAYAKQDASRSDSAFRARMGNAGEKLSAALSRGAYKPTYEDVPSDAEADPVARAAAIQNYVKAKRGAAPDPLLNERRDLLKAEAERARRPNAAPLLNVKEVDPLAREKTQAEIDRLKAEAERARRLPVSKAAKPADTTKAAQASFKDSMDLRKEFENTPEVKSFKDVDTSFQKMRKASAVPSAAGDLSLIFSFMKMLDPTSSVREGEFANAQNAGSIPSNVMAAYNKAKTGERLDDGKRADFMKQAENFHAAHRERFDSTAAQYASIAKKRGLDTSDVIFDSKPKAVPAPKNLDDAPVHPDDSKAVKWARDNPKDPRSAAILAANGAQ